MPDSRDAHPEMTMELDSDTLAQQIERINTSLRKRACFVILGGLDLGSIFLIEKSVVTVGRDPTCDLVLRDDGISRRHVEARRVGGNRLFIKDLNSTNGIFVDGERVTQTVLSDGDKVLLGRRSILKFALQDEIEQSYQQQMYESTTKDGLTKTFNRKYFAQKIVSDVSFARRHNIPFTLIILDIDFFKKVNDTYGHRTGDVALVTVTESIRQTIRAEDALARYGGEEFAVLALGTNLKGGETLAERIRVRIAEQTIRALDDEGQLFRVTASFGVATLPGGVEAEPEAVVSLADKNLYRAKEAGRNQIVASSL
jgi:two-component system, cell cycle response regulator